ncbi:conserved repeat domain protein [Leadbetterella byssophila DSM 17132]|uniref:Conserved repeat domain protein n=1 Tax=Leadbetterella byssophila (strain DSM 17132 / JCM 16389 / KACC 11308 / NBRC 106382 / 4M15) TaxID=649349 RepID=E4RRT6_LEAB4|nr:T9SS C-terminal target domain-containing protein [Leadbetterella byssophila]ADQ17623.1 conserved repeat domain protein [Leadbetterella byssophila DSM 17132]
MKPNFTKFHYRSLLLVCFLFLGAASGYAHSGKPYLEKYKEGMRMLYPIRTLLFGEVQAKKVKASATEDKYIDGKCYSDIFSYCFGQEIEIEIEAEEGYQNYQWFKDDVAIPGATDAIYVIREPGSYYFTAEDAVTCEAKLCCPYLVKREADFDVQVVKTDVVCAGGNTGSIVVTPTTGDPKDYMYSLNDAPFQQSNSFSQLAAGSYKVNVKSPGGCLLEKTVIISQPELLKAVALAECIQDTTHASISVTGGTAPYLYSLDGGPFVQDSIFVGLSEGQHEVLVKDKNGCTAKVVVDAFCDCTPEIFEYCPGDSIAILAEAAPDQGVYQWFKNGEAIEGATSSTYMITSPGNYHYTSGGDDQCDGVLCCPIIVREKEVPTLQVKGGELSCLTTSIQLSSGADDQLTHLWEGPNGFTAHTSSITVTEPGTYKVSVTSESGCVVSDTAIVTQDTVMPYVTVKGGELNCDVTSIELKAEASEGVSYSWSGPLTGSTDQLLVNAPGSYIITVTAANGCIARDTAFVTENKQLPTVKVNGGELTCLTPEVNLFASASAGVTFAWQGPEGFTSTDQSINVTVPGLYKVTVKGENGCIASDSTTVTENKQFPTVTVNGGELNCNIASLELKAEGTAGVQYIWSGPNDFQSTSASVNVTTPGSYIVKATLPNGCFAIDTAIVTENKVLPLVSVNDGELNCDVTSVSLNANASEGVSYLWSGPAGFTSTDSSINVSVAGMYIIKVTGLNGCIAQDTAQVTEDKTYPTVTASGGEINCITETVDLKAVGSAGVSYAWTGPNGFTSHLADTTTSQAGTYIVTVTAANGCIAKDTVVVTENKVLPTLQVNGGELTCLVDSLVLKAVASPGVSFAWTGPNGFTSNNESITINQAGTYFIKVTATNGCFKIDSAIVTEDKVLPTVAVNGGELTCEINKIELKPVITGGTKVEWTGPNGFSSSTANIDATIAGIYYIKVTGANGCFVTDSVVVTENKVVPTVAVNDVELDCIEPNAIIKAVASAGVTYSWRGPNGFTASTDSILVDKPGSYIVTVTSANGCTASDTSVVTENKQPPLVTVNGGVLNCATDTLVLSANASPNVTYLWTGPNGFTSNSESITINQAGTYFIKVTATNGCFKIDSAIITEDKVLPTVAVNGGELTCEINKIELKPVITGGTKVEWTGPNGFSSSSANIDATIAGIYYIKVTGANGCFVTDSVVVTENKVVPTVAVKDVELDCIETNAIIKAVASAGVTYSWRGPNGFTASTDSILVDKPGSYIVTVTSSNGCTASDTSVVTENKQPPLVTVNGGILNCVTDTLVLSANASPNVTYLWTGPNGFTGSAASVSVTLPGIYSVKVTGANGCTAVDTATVTEDKVLPIVSVKGGELNCTTETLVIKAEGSTGVTYSWTGPDNFTSSTQSINVNKPGTYVVTVKGANGCMATDSAVVTENKVLPQVTVKGGEINCIITSLTLKDEGTSGANYTWAGPDGYSATGTQIQVTKAGVYTVTATGLNGCTAKDTAVVQVNQTLPTVTVNQVTLTCAEPSGKLIATGTPGNTYLWTGPGGFTATTDTITVTLAGEYTVVVTGTNGCTMSAKTVVKKIEAPTLAASATCVNNQGKVTLVAAGGVGPYAYSKDGITFQSEPVFTGLGNGNYTFTVRDANGCLTTTTVAVKCEIECVPQIYTFCEGEAIEVTIEAEDGLTNYQWFRNGEIIVGATSKEYVATEPGRYYYTAGTGDQCDGILCCPIEIKRFPGMNTLASAGKLDCTNGPVVPVTISVSGGTAPFAYSIDGITYVTSNVFLVGPGTHKFWVKDANGCVKETNAVVVPEIEMPKPPIVTVDKTTVCGVELATLTAGCAVGQVVQWNNGMIGSTIQVGVGTYTAVCTNECGKSEDSKPVTINKGELPKIPEVGTDKTLLCGNELATLQAHCTVGDVVEWSNGMYGQTIQVPAGIYTARCKNTCGYSGDSRHLVITKGNVPGSPEIGADKYMVCGNEKATLVAQCEVGSIVVWSHGVTGTTIQVGEGIYTANCKNDCGLSEESRHITINKGKVPEAPIVSADKVLICGEEKAKLSSTCPVGTITKWNTGAEGISIFVGEGIYSAVCINTCGTSAESNKVVISKDKLPAAPRIATDKNTVCGEEKATLTGSCESGLLIWSTGQSGLSIEVGKGTYTAKCVSDCGTSVSSDPITITTGGAPNKPIIVAEETTVCGDEKVKLTAFCTSGTVSWIGVNSFNSSVMVGVGIYAAKCVNECGTSVASDPVSITTGPTPGKPVITSNVTGVCGNEKAILSGNCPLGGELVWDNGMRGSQIQVGVGVYSARCENACGTSPSSNVISIENGGTPSAPRISANRTSVCGDEKVTLTGTCPTGGTLTWSHGVSGSPILVGQGTYTATCVNNCGSSPQSTPITIVPGLQPSKPTITVDKNVVCGAELATLTGSCPAGGNLRWSNGMTALQIQVTPGTYWATCVNDCGTSPQSESITIVPGNVPSKPIVNASKPSLCDGEKATLTATCSTGSVMWSNGATGSPIEVGIGTYTAYCKNDCGLSDASETIKIEVGKVPGKPVIQANKLAVCGDEKAMLTGTCPTGGTLEWSNGTTGNPILVSAGTYFAVCKNTCGSSPSSEPITITTGELPTKPEITASALEVCGTEKVTLTASCTSGTVKWVTGATTPSILVGAGSYTAVCINSCGVSGNSKTVVITPVDKPTSPTLTPLNEAVCGEGTTVITATCPAGSTLQWTSGQTGNPITVGAGTYKAVCISSCGTSAETKVTIKVVPNPVKPVIATNKTTLCGDDKATLTATCTVGTVLWSDGNTQNPRYVGIGTYTAICVSSCGNSEAALPIVIQGSPGPQKPVTNTNKYSVCGNEKATLTGTCPTGGTLTWSHGATGSPVLVGAGTYTATCVNTCGTSASSEPIVIGNGDKPSAPTVTSNKPEVCGTDKAMLTATCTSGTVQWSDGTVANPRFVGAGTYYAFCKNDCGISVQSNTVTIEHKPTPQAPSIHVDKFEVCGTEKATLVATCQTGTSVTWSNGATTSSIQVGAGTYTATCTSECGSSPAAEPVVIRKGNTPSVPVVTPSGTQICGTDLVTLTAYCASGTVVWSDGNTQNPRSVGAGTYSAKCQSDCGLSGSSTPVTINSGQLPSAPIVKTNVSTVCDSEKATITATCTSGTVMWSDGSTQPTRQVGAGTYYAVCVNTCGVSEKSQNLEIKSGPVPTKPIVKANKDIVCGEEKATLTATCPTGGNIVWSNGMTGSPILVKAGKYTAICKNTCGSSEHSDEIEIKDGAKPQAPVITPSKSVLCGDEKAILTATGCAGGTLQWSNGSTGNSITVGAGTYRVVCVTTCGASDNSAAVTITKEQTPANFMISSSKAMVCGTEKAIIKATGCEGGTVTWSNGMSGYSIEVGAGTYSATCRTECGGAVNAGPVTIKHEQVPTKPSISPDKYAVCGTDKATLTATACTGTITWYRPSETGGVSLGTGNTIAVGSGTYYATCTTACGTSDASNPVTISSGDKPSAPSIVVDKPTVCEGEKATLTASGCTGTLTWSTGATGNSIQVGKGTYFVKCTTACGTSDASTSVTIGSSDKPAAPAVMADKLNVCGTEKATLTAHGCAGTIKWSTGATGNSIEVGAGTYTATCTSACGTSDKSVPVTIGTSQTPNAPSITVDKPSICGEEKATLTAIGCNGTVKWSNGSTEQSIVVGEGTYTVTCTTACGTSPASNPVIIKRTNVPNAPSISANKSVVCGTEKATLTATGCTGSILWSNGATTATIEVGAGTYTAICTGTCGNSPASNSVTIQTGQVPSAPVIQPDKLTVCGTEKATLTASGCTGTLTWSTGQTVSVIQVGVGTYTATCTTACGTSQASNTVTIGTSDKPAAPQVVANKTKVCGAEKATLTASGCVGTVTWSTGQTVSVIQVGVGTYTATCTTACGTSDASTTISIGTSDKPAAPSVVANKSNVCEGEKATITASGCAGTVTWSTGATGSSIQVGVGSYTATCTTECGTSDASVAVTIGTSDRPSAPQIASNKATVCDAELATITATGCSGTITWSNGATGASIQVGAGTYTATCTTSCGTSDVSNTVQIGTSEKPAAPQIVADKSTVCTDETATLTANGCAGTVTWSNGANGTSIQVGSGTYTATCTSSCGVSESSAPIHIGTSEKPAKPTIASSGDGVCGDQKVTLTASGCSGTLQWSNGMTGTSIQVGAGSYTVTCTTACGTSDVASIQIHEGGSPEPPVVTSDRNSICGSEKATLTASGCVGGTIHWSTGATGFSIQVGAGVYTATCIDACGNESIACIAVEIDDTAEVPSTPTISANKDGVCGDEKAILTASGCTGGTIVWSTGQQGQQIEVSAGVYTAICKTSCGTSEASNAVTIVAKGGSISITSDKSSYCVGDAVTLTASGCSNGVIKWSNGVTGNVLHITAGTTTTYTAVCVTEESVSSCDFHVGDIIFQVETQNNPNGMHTKYLLTDLSYGILQVKDQPKFTQVQAGEYKVISLVYIGEIQGLHEGANYSSVDKGACFSDDETEISVCNPVPVNECEAVGSFTLNVKSAAECGNGECGLAPTLISSVGNGTCVGTQVILTAQNCVGQVVWSNGQTGASISFTAETVGATTYTAKCVSATCESASSAPLTITVTSTLPKPVAIETLNNICPLAYVDLRNAILGEPGAGNVFEFHYGNSPSTPLVTSAQVTAGTYYLFERSSTGCFSEGTPVKVEISGDCQNPIYPDAVDVAIEKVGDKTTAQINDDITYTVTIKNIGERGASDIKVRDIVPQGLQVMQISENAFMENGQVRVSIDTLAPGQSVDVTYSAKVTTNGRILNKAELISVVQNDTNTNNNSSTWVINDSAAADSLIGLAKAVGAVTKAEIGNRYKVPFVFTLANMGKNDLSNISLRDTLSNTFGPLVSIDSVHVSADSGLVVNPNYTGVGEHTDLLIPSQSQIASGSTLNVRMDVFVNLGNNASMTFINSATVYSGSISDRSTDGVNPDPDMDGDPTNNNVPTRFQVGDGSTSYGIGVALAVVDTAFVNDGTAYEVTYRVKIKNYGADTLTHVYAVDSLMNTFADAIDFTVSGKPVVNEGSTWVPNPDFNGKDDVRILLPEAESILAPGQTDSVEFKVTVVFGDHYGPYSNSVTGYGMDGDSLLTDISNAGLEIIPSSSTPTEFTVPGSDPRGLVEIPEGFSPNGDGKNDNWKIELKGNAKIEKLQIVNRYGAVLYEEDGETVSTSGWDGKANTGLIPGNTTVPSGTYFYKLKLAGQSKYIIDYITIEK